MDKAQARRLPTVLVLASGLGARFTASGGVGHKLQADLAGKTVLQHTLDAVRSSGLRWHLEDAGHPGMGDSIAAAVRATRDAAGWLVLPADLPLILHRPAWPPGAFRSCLRRRPGRPAGGGGRGCRGGPLPGAALAGAGCRLRDRYRHPGRSATRTRHDEHLFKQIVMSHQTLSK
jgi:hypothetical protein